MALKIAYRALDQLMEQKPKGGLVVHKGTELESRMSYQEAKLCLERIERKFALQGAFSLGICGGCTKWKTDGHCTGKWEDYGNCIVTRKTMHRYDSCDQHSIKNGGWGLPCTL